MSFTFQVERAWSLDSVGVYHLIGYLRSGTILPGARAYFCGLESYEITVKNVVVTPKAPALEQEDQLTISIERPNFELSSVEGRELIQE